MKGRCTAVNGLSFRKGSRRTEVSSIKRQIPGPAFGSAKTDIGTTIVSMLEVAEADFTRLLAEAETAEKAAAA